MNSIDFLIDLEATLCSIHICRDGKRIRLAIRAESISFALIRPDGVQRTYIYVFRSKRIKLAESFEIELPNDCASIVLDQRPARHAGIGAAQDFFRLQILRFRDVGNRVRFAALVITTVEHSLTVSIIPVVSERVAVLHERRLDNLDLIRQLEQEILFNLIPVGGFIFAVSVCRIRIHDDTGIGIGDKFPTCKRNSITDISLRNREIAIRNIGRSDFIDAIRRPFINRSYRSPRSIIQTELSRKLIRTFINISKLDGLYINIETITIPNGIQRHRIHTTVWTFGISLIVLINNCIIEFCVCGSSVFSKCIPLQTSFIAIQAHREHHRISIRIRT